MKQSQLELLIKNQQAAIILAQVRSMPRKDGMVNVKAFAYTNAMRTIRAIQAAQALNAKPTT